MTAPGGSDSGNYSPSFGPEESYRTQPNRSSRKSKHIPEIESLPEGLPLYITQRSTTGYNKGNAMIINLKHDSSDAELHDLLSSRESSIPTEAKTLSMPNSPMKTFEFFMELESADASSNDQFDSNSPKRKLSDKTRNIVKLRQDIKKNYLDLQKKLQQELETKRAEWVKLRPELESCAGKN